MERQSQVGVGSASALVAGTSQRIAKPVRAEVQSAHAETTEKGTRHGTGDGPFALFAAAGVLGLFAAEALMATCVAALALVLPVWTAALAITGVIAAMAAVTAFAGKQRITKAGVPIPDGPWTG
ncbi:phage holin family protein [Streptomyces sp. NPDC059355]|uniref:phage holin family protein n=1 Tax=Streptomyces sp. NPDC059355 TaxID=3346811 RepID=UPI0036B3AC8F